MLLEINFTAVFFAISFLIFIYFLNLTLFKPVGQVIEQRRNLIEGDIKKAKELTEKANSMLEDYKSQIKSARHQAQNIVQEGINQAQKSKQEKISALTVKLKNEKEEALKQIKKEQESVLKQLENQIKTLTDLITNKVIGTEEKTLVSPR